SNDHPGDKATATFAVEVPRDWMAIANGSAGPVDTLADGRRVWHWREDHRIPVYTMVIGAGRMLFSPVLPQGSFPTTVLAFPEDVTFAMNGPFRRAAAV